MGNSRAYFITIHQIITAGHWITDQVSRELREFGISEPQYNVLRTLKEAKGDPITVQEIQKAMVQRSSNVTRIIDKLVAKECVERKECPENRRKMDITITATGLELLAELDKRVTALHAPMMDKLSVEELITLKKLISTLIDTSNE